MLKDQEDCGSGIYTNGGGGGDDDDIEENGGRML
jgi:hypothetical protein